MIGSKKGACSAHIEAAKANCLQHARRDGHVPSYVNPHLTMNNRTVYEDDAIKYRKSIVPLKKRAEKEYTEKTGQKCQKSFTPFREDVLVIREGTTDEQLMQFKTKVEALTGWKVMGIWIHNDEGHFHSKYIEGDENFAINHHAHVLYNCVDHATGKAIRCTRDYFRKRQDILAECTGMDRGNPATETGKNHRNAQKQRIEAQERRIEELTRITEDQKIKMQTMEEHHRGEMQRMEDEKAKAMADAKSSIWHRIKDVFGADEKINELEETIANEPARVMEAVASAREHERRQVIDEIKVAASLRVGDGGNETAQQIGKAWRKAYDSSEAFEKQVKSQQQQLQNLKEEMKPLKKRIDIMEKIERAMTGCCNWAAKCARGSAAWQWVYETFEALCDAKGIHEEWKNGRHSVAADVWLATVDPDKKGRAYGKFSQEQQEHLADELHKAADNPELGRGRGITR